MASSVISSPCWSLGFGAWRGPLFDPCQMWGSILRFLGGEEVAQLQTDKHGKDGHTLAQLVRGHTHFCTWLRWTHS